MMNCYHSLFYAVPTQTNIKQKTTSAETSAGTYAVSVSDLKNDQVVQCLVSRRRGAMVPWVRQGRCPTHQGYPTNHG